MDVSSLRVADTAAIHLKNAAGDLLYDGDNPVKIILYGPGSKPFATIESRQTNRAVKRMADNDGKIAVVPPEQRKTELSEDLAAITVRFEHLTYGDKQGTDLFEAVYADPALGFIAAQVQKFLGDWGNFKPGSTGT